MINSKLIHILKTFSEPELKDFMKFSRSLYFNKGRNCLPLLKTLRNIYPNFSDAKLTKDYLHEILYPGKKNNDQVIRNMLSGLLKICEQFIVINKIKSDEPIII